MNYKIVQDKELLLEFIHKLPDLMDDEVYYICLFARTKYVKDEEGKNLFPHIQTDKSQLKRVLAKKERIYEKIKQMECEIGSYTSKGIAIPQEALALYITFNPMSMKKAAKQMLKKLADFVTESYNGYNIVQEAFSQVHKAPSRKIYLDFDFDYVELSDIKDKVYSVINEDCVKFLQTKGGIHVLIETAKISNRFEKTWHNGITSIKGYDKDAKSSMIPVVGCCQGDFIPYFHKINK